jgi:SAM-dependent methyltransferase
VSLETIDLDRLALGKGTTLLDVGCGEGRHTLSAWLRAPIHAVGLDLSARDLATARARQADFSGQAPEGAQVEFLRASALAMPFPDASFDVVICSEVLEHIHDYRGVLAEIDRVLRPGGRLAVSVPRAWPERLCWLLSDPYHEAPGGHIRIVDARHLARVIETFGLQARARHGAHALHVPYWWLRCAAGSDEAADASALVRSWHRLLVWDLMKAPRTTRTLERLLDPVFGKSVVMYFDKPGRHRGTLPTRAAARAPSTMETS